MIGGYAVGSACLAGGLESPCGSAGNTLAIDESVTGAHGVYSGTPTLRQPSLLSGDPDTCVRFETESEYVWIGRHTVFSFTPNIFTFEFWYRPTAENAYEGILSKVGDGYEYAILRVGAAVQFDAYTSAGGTVYSTSYTLVDTLPHYYAWAADGANARLYTNIAGVITLLSTVAKSGASMSATSSVLKLGTGTGIAAGLLGRAASDVLTMGFTDVSSLAIFGPTSIAKSETIKVGFQEVSSLVITGRIDLTTNDSLKGSVVEFSVVEAEDATIIAITAADTLGITVAEPQDVVGEVVTNDSLTVRITDSSATSISELGAGRPALGASKTRMGPHHIPTRRHP